MKRKAKQRKSNFSPINQTQNSYDCTSKSDGPRTRSSNEYQEHSKAGAIPPVLGSDRCFPARGRLSRSASDSDCAVFNSVAVRGSSRGRRSKTAAQPAAQSVLDSRSQSVSYDQTISLSDYKRFELSKSILQDYEQEDTAAPDLVAMHDLSVSSTPSTFVESRHFTDKSDVNTLHNQRRLNKRELKALLKQTKKSRAVVDENILATMEQLADRIKAGCVIDLNPAPPKPIRFASPPPYVLPAATPRTKLVSTRGRGGRKGRGGRRGGSKMVSESTEKMLSRSIPASWVPLILPCQSLTAEHSALKTDSHREHFRPWLNELSEARLNRFSMSLRNILSQHFPDDALLTSHPLTRPETATCTVSRNGFSSTLQSNNTTILSDLNASTTSLSRIPSAETVPSTTCASGAPQLAPDHSAALPLPLIQTDVNRAVDESQLNDSPLDSRSLCMSVTNQAELRDVSTNSYPYSGPPYRSRGRGRGRGRRFHRSAAIVSRNASVHGHYQSSATLSSTLSPSKSFARGTGSTRSKPRVSRELRGLVTWDAVMAQQKRQQEQGHLDPEVNADRKSQTMSDALLAVAHDMIAAAAVDEDNVNSRTRRTRQSSGSAVSQSGPSTFHSDSASVATASGSAALEAGYRPKLALSSTARSGVSTESSSVSSDLFTSHVQGFEHGEVQSYDKPSMSSPVTLISNPTTKLEHKEVYSNSEVDVASLHPTPPCCGEQSGSLGPVKYSPISTDQDPDLSLTADVDLVQEKTFENIQKPQCHFASHKRRGRKQTKHSSQIPTSVESVSLVANNKLETVGDMSTSSTPCTSEPSGSCTGTVLTSTGKRRRQSLHSPAVHLSESEAISGRVDSDDWSGLHSPEEAISGLGNSPSGGSRRANGSRSAALPPRKRYKAGVDTSTSVTLSSTHLIQDGSGDGPINSLSEPGIIGALVEQEEMSRQNKAELSSALISSASVLSSEPVKKRGRGRPSRRGALTGAAHPVPTLPTSPYTPPSDTVLSVDRPKREAAAIGFASLVAANLNNSTAQAGSTQSMDSPTRRTPTSDMPLVISSPVVANMSHEGNRLVMPIRQAPRGRGRPPRPKTILELSMTSGAVSSAATEVTSSTAPRKRSAEPPSPTQKVYKDEHSQASLCPDSAVVPPAKKIPRVAASRAGVRRRPSQSNENGIAATEIPTEVPWKIFVDQLSNKASKSHIEEPQGSYNHLASNRSVGPTTGPSNAPMRGRKGRPRIHERPLPHQSVENLVSSPVVKLPINPANVSALANLPGRATLFSGHSLKDPILLGTNPDAPCKGPLCDLFLRFLNEPDPFDPTCRLVAPIVYLPTPERNPEFYRFVISSYSSGSGFRIRFSDALLRRIFTTSSMNPCQLQQKSAKNEEGAVFDVEFPSLCLASIARRLYDRTTLQAGVGDLTDWLHSPNGLTESELACVPLDATDTENCLPLLDAAIESLLTVWESFAGRRSWLGRRLTRLRTVYSTVRTECALSIANNYGLIVPPLKATAVLNLPYYKPLGPGTKKKSDRRALERGAEVIRCLCGFRVEGGHVMVQCDHCAAWQHLPCLWWALNRAITSPETKNTERSLCEAALAAAQAAGSGYLNDLTGPGVVCGPQTSSGGSANTPSGKSDGNDPPYFCPICLDLQALTLEYPRSLSAAMAMDDLSSVFSLQETIVEGEHEFWSLASPDGNHQIRTDDYAFVNRIWLQFSQSPTSLTATKRADTKQAEQGFAAAKAQPIECAYDRLVIRIYRLWKDSSGESWLEGGLFLRPYDVVQTGDLPSEKTFAQSRLWHHREVIYDEASRLVLPLRAWNGRCVVLCPSAYRTGRPADLLSAEEATRFLVSDTVCSKGFVSDHGTVESSSLGHAFFVCDKLFERTPGSCAVGYRFDEISPGYLKVNMKPYCFLRKPDVPGLGRPNLQRQFTASQLLEIDRASSLVNNPLSNIQSNSITRTSRGDDITNTTHSEQPKGAKLAKLVAWLERKRQQDAKITDNCSVNQCSVNLSASCTHSSTTAVPVVRPPNGRGRPPKGSRGRGRPPRTTAVVHLSAPPIEGSQNELMTQHDRPVCASESISAETLCASLNNDQNVETIRPTVEPRELVTAEVFTAVTHTSSTTESHPSCCSDSVATSVLPMDAENRSPVSSGYPSNDNKSENQKSLNEHTMTSDVNKLSALMDIHEETDHMSDSRSHHSRCTSSNSPLEVRSSCSGITENKMDMLMTTPDTREKILERLTSRRKRITSRKRTASESKPPINPLPLVHDIPRFLSDSETTEPVFFMPDLSDKIVPPLMDHETSSPVPLVDDVTVDRKSLTPNSLSESTRPVCSVTSQNNSATPGDASKKTSENEHNHPILIADCSIDIIDGIDTTADSCIGPASEQDLLVESVSTLSDINHEFSSLEASNENSVPVVDQIGNELAEEPQILVVSRRTHPESVTPLGAVAQSDSSLTTETGCESKAANQCPPDGDDKESGLESQPVQICRTEIYSVTDPCNEPTSNNASVCFVSVSASENSADPTSPQKPIVFGDEFVGIPTNRCYAEDRRGSETSLKLVVENNKSQFDETLVSTETVCESNVQPETLVSDSHLSPTRSRDLTSLLSPVSESTSDFADPSDTVQLTEKTSAPVDESQPDCKDPPEYDIIVDPDSTPILDEPGGHGRFDSESNSTGPNEFSAVSCISETMNALFFTVNSNANRIESESHDRVSPVIPDSTAFSQRPSAGPRNTEENTSDSNHTNPYGPRKDCRADSRHGCIHRDRPSSRHQSHKSDRHRHHHKHDRNRRDHSPTSSRHSSSSGGGNRHSRSQRSPTTFDGRRKGHSHDHTSQHESPSNSSRSSASSISHRYTHQPHHYRHHSRKESGRSREGDSSSADFDSGRSTSHDHSQLAGPRRP